MKKTAYARQALWLSCAIVVLLPHAACSAQAPNTSAAKPIEDPAPKMAPKVASDGSLQPGEYVTEKGWGRLLLNEQGGALVFSLETITGEDTCGLDGAVQGQKGTAKSDNGASVCTVKFTNTSHGIDVSATTSAECKTFCGYNGNFEGPYLRVKNGCGREDLDRTRDTFQRLYDDKDYKAALATLSPALTNCLPTLEWEDEGAIRNDLAITQYKNGLYAECLATLDKYAENASKDDRAVIDGWTPTLADRYLAIVRAARTNIGLCRKKLHANNLDRKSSNDNMAEPETYGAAYGISSAYEECLAHQSAGASTAGHFQGCADQELEFQRTRLNRVYQNLMIKANNNALKSMQMRDAQQNWELQLDETCAQTIEKVSSTMGPAAQSECYMEQTAKRANDLEVAYKLTPASN